MAASSPFDRIEILPYRPGWPGEYSGLVRVLRNAAPPGALFHHIGSTAVPGLAAKDIIDIQVTAASLDDLDAEALAGLGYLERPGLSDHSPPGRSLPAPELAKRVFRGVRRPANLHVRAAGRFNQRYPLLCRDYLRAHPVAAAAYQTVKQRLAEWFPQDAGCYYDIKDPVFDIILDGAEAWARLTGWELPPPDG